jgi:hypothetical protein
MHIPTQAAQPVQVSVANGAKMLSTELVENFTWLTQGQTFSTTLRVLPLQCYDIVLGMDWLETFSPVWIHWRRKILRFTHKGSRIQLHGIKPKTSSCFQISVKKLKGLMRKGGIAQLMHLSPVLDTKEDEVVPTSIQQVVNNFADMFQEPKELPPSRPMDHHIPLIPGATPVNVKLYLYSPAQKDEIEQPLQEMLRNGIIQPSVSPFASPVLLVKKKDGSWSFCVDYRRLNALTMKNKYPMPVVEELLDELHGACWFTKLDLRSRYHQIIVVDVDVQKTAFKTHDGH